MMRKSLASLLFAGALGAGLTHAASPAASIVDAALQGNRDAVRAFLKDGADVNTSQLDGMTSLHWAAQKGDVELAKTLLYAGANVKATTRLGGYTPLLIASKSGNATMIETLAAAGADANAATTSGASALMFAAQAGNADAVKVLIAHGANVNAREKAKGETALTFAAAYGRADVIRVLAAHGADPSLTTSVMDLAAFNKEEQERLLMFQQQLAAQAPAGRG